MTTPIGDAAFLVSDETMAQWTAEARAHPPRVEDWAHMVAMLRLAAEIDKGCVRNSEQMGTATASSECALQAIINFLQAQTYTDKHGEAVAPLVRLLLALVDISRGKSPPMFQPQRASEAIGAPPAHAAIEMIKGLAARAVSELRDAEISLPEATQQVADALQAASSRSRNMLGKATQKGFGKITAETVKNWRARIMEGEGPGASPLAIANYKAPLPPGMGETPKARADNLLMVLRDRTASLI